MSGYELTEGGNAKRLAAAHGNRLRYVAAWCSWLEWDGARWKRTDRGAAEMAAKQVAQDLFAKASELAKAAANGDRGAGDSAANLLKWAKRSDSRRVVENVAHLAQTESPIRAAPEDFDRDPDVLNVLNGAVDLRSGKLRKHDPSAMLTQLAPVDYNPAARCPEFDRFLLQVMPDTAQREWFHRFVGYLFTGHVNEQMLLYAIGGGANGKSTLFGVLQRLLGDYAVQAPAGLLLAQPRGGDELGRRQRASLEGKRMALCQEIDADQYFNEAQMKQLTGGDRVTAARLYQDEAEFSPTHKLVIAANYKPHVRGQDHAVWRRIKLLPFPVTISDRERDPGLPSKLWAEASGILAWGVRGAIEWYRQGLGTCAAIDCAVSEYRDDEDTVGKFLAECTTNDAEAFTSTEDLRAAHNDWCGEEEQLSRVAMGRAMEGRGYRRDRRQQQRGFIGVALRDR